MPSPRWRRLRAGSLPARARLLATISLTVLASAVAAAAPAGADVLGPISLVSEGSVPGAPEAQQSEYAHDSAISGDGRYVAFDGSFHGVTGVWRAELRGGKVVGEIQQVAGGDAELPSISETGQYVSFTTNEGASLPEITYGLHGEAPTVQTGKQEAVNVYVRNMAIGHEQPEAFKTEAFKIVSALNGSDEPLTYSDVRTERGSVAAGRSAIDAEGNEVVFVTTAVSDLAQGTPAEPETPALQVAVRNLNDDTTKLVSVNRETGGPVSVQEGSVTYGAVYPDSDSSTGTAPAFAPPAAYGGAMPPPGASISANGYAVAWMGTSIEQQAPLLPGEHRGPNYTEPLWRWIEPGAETPIERVTGGSDPTNPACVASGELKLPATASTTDPCQGPFVAENGHPTGGLWIGGERGNPIPQLSGSGLIVAFLSKAPLVSAGENFGIGDAGQPSDLYVSAMVPSLTRDQALTRLTELAGGEGAPLADTAQIFDFAISPDGEQIAFTTERTQFPLGFPAFVSPPAGEAGMDELFDADLADGTLTRVTHGYAGPDEPSEAPHGQTIPGEDPYKLQPGDGALSPSFSDDGGVLAFSSTASNLAFGDGNTPPAGPLDGSDVFAVERAEFTPLPTPQEISAAPEAAIDPAWQLGVTALSRPDGSVVLYVRTPGAGTLSALARGSVPVAVAAAPARRGRRASRSRGASRTRPDSRDRQASAARVGTARGTHGHRQSRETVSTRTLATASERTGAASEEPVALVLEPAAQYAALAARGGGLSASVSLTFTASGHPRLRASVAVSFSRTARPAARARRAKADRDVHGARDRG